MNKTLEIINNSWSWTGLVAVNILKINDFGNLILEDKEGKIWRILPEDLSCLIIAENTADFDFLKNTEEFSIDWEMINLLELANFKIGSLSSDEKYCLKIPSVLGGTYTEDNIGKISFHELLAFSGDLAKQIKDYPDGSKIKLIFSE